jgi:hypothetical protein
VNIAEWGPYLTVFRDRAEAAAVPAANAMTEAYHDHLIGFTLIESGSHPPVTRTPAPPGRPPAVMPGGVNGSLIGSVTRAAAVPDGPGIATGSVQPNTIYAATQEWGGVHHGSPYMLLWVRYVGPYEVRKRGWRKAVVDIPARPYMRTAVAEMIATGELSRVAGRTFSAYTWG